MPPEAPAPPNIVLILVDDMGFSDIGCYGSEIATPHIDGLAAGGVRFTRAYNAARCCPTRASILTGLYPHQAGVGHMVGDHGLPAYQGYLTDRCVTLAEALAPAGYRATISGKWHCGGTFARNDPTDWSVPDPTRPLPPDRGFADWFGTPAGAGSYFNPKPLMKNYDFIEPLGDDWYYTDAVAEHACRQIRESVRQGQPFFQYVAYTAPHWPLHAMPEDIERYRGRYAAGWDALRSERYERLMGQGFMDGAWRLSPRDEACPPWEDVPAEERAWMDLRMAVYAAQVDRMDQGVGRVLRTLDELGVADNTLVMFLSDNGGCHEGIGQGQADREWTTTRDGRPVHFGNTPSIDPGPRDTYQSYGRPWANASNIPFRYFKSYTHEGGIATPLVARWPGRLPAGSVTHALAHVVDVMPTCLEAAGASYPDARHETPTTPLAGESLVPYMEGGEPDEGRQIFWEHVGNRAVRDGRWKLVSHYVPGDRRNPKQDLGPWELYDMVEDRTELMSLADKDPERVKRMASAYGAWAARCGVVPHWEIFQRPPR